MDTKESLRARLLLQRRLISPDRHQSASLQICDRLTALSDVQNAHHIAVYIAIDQEIELASFIEWCFTEGKTLYAPAYHTASQAYVLTRLHSMTDVQKGRHGVSEPPLSDYLIPSNFGQIDGFLVPGIGFDRQGYRLGFGKGYYDRLLIGFSGLKIGIGYEEQIIFACPADPWDVPMTMVVTEKSVYLPAE